MKHRARFLALLILGAGGIAACGTDLPRPILPEGIPDAPSSAGVGPVVPGNAPGVHEVAGTLFGNESVPRGSDNTHAAGYALMRDLGMTTIREGWNWRNVEVGKHQYVSWMDYFDQKAATFAQMGVKVQAMVTDTPDWASSDPRYASRTGWDEASLGRYTVPAGLGDPVFADGTDIYKPGVKANPGNYYAAYMFDMVTRYKGKIHYWQAWNEPDFPSGDLTAGTTSNGSNRYWTGSVDDYVRLLKVSHVIVKGIDSEAKVTLGGLGHEKYLAGIIDRGGAAYFDVVDFHAYGSDKRTSNGVLNSDWGFLGRYRAMKQVLLAKGVKGKTFGCSETGFTADNPSEQASYVGKLFATAAAQGDIETVQWAVFANPGFGNIGLIDKATLSQKTQGYHAYKFAADQLSGAVPVSEVRASGVEGYQFRRRDGKALYVVWTSAGTARLTLPMARAQVLDKTGHTLGATIEAGKLALDVTSDPTFVVGG
ncbi:MAG TPA: hypothetical protein V6D00_10605 [Pantanalinema sp.]